MAAGVEREVTDLMSLGPTASIKRSNFADKVGLFLRFSMSKIVVPIRTVAAPDERSGDNSSV